LFFRQDLQPRLVSDLHSPTFTSWVGGIIGVHHHTWLIFTLEFFRSLARFPSGCCPRPCCYWETWVARTVTFGSSSFETFVLKPSCFHLILISVVFMLERTNSLGETSSLVLPWGMAIQTRDVLGLETLITGWFRMTREYS
jgi:hypothetical protein